MVFVFQRCHFCEKGDKEELLLLCDGCDTGYHTYCHKPKMSTVPDGEWFCANCIFKVITITVRHGGEAVSSSKILNFDVRVTSK